MLAIVGVILTLTLRLRKSSWLDLGAETDGDKHKNHNLASKAVSVHQTMKREASANAPIQSSCSSRRIGVVSQCFEL
jgi:hypothetical protein